MRKVRDYDAELKSLKDKERALKARKVEQLGALVVATGADTLDLEVIAGMLRQGVTQAKEHSVKEGWRADGATFLKRRGRKDHKAAESDGSSNSQKHCSEAAG